jgi:hypothetical protein
VCGRLSGKNIHPGNRPVSQECGDPLSGTVHRLWSLSARLPRHRSPVVNIVFSLDLTGAIVL